MSIASVSLTQLVHVGYVRLLHGRFFLEGRLFVENDGMMHQYLTYVSPHVWDDALRAGLAAVVMSTVYVLWANSHIADGMGQVADIQPTRLERSNTPMTPT